MTRPKPVPLAKKKVLIVDDHPLLREGLGRVIDRQPDLVVCGEAGTAQEALVAVKKFKPDIAVVDISLPGRDGLELTKDLRALHPKLPVLVLSMHDETVYAVRALRAGARGYIMKREPVENHLGAIRKVLAGETAVSPHIVTRLAQQANAGGNLSPLEVLTDRELEIFRMLGEGHTRAAIATALHLSVKTIESHRDNIRQKLGVPTAAELRQHAIEFLRDEAGALPRR